MMIASHQYSQSQRQVESYPQEPMQQQLCSQIQVSDPPQRGETIVITCQSQTKNATSQFRVINATISIIPTTI